jgi:hypothetical protein
MSEERFIEETDPHTHLWTPYEQERPHLLNFCSLCLRRTYVMAELTYSNQDGETVHSDLPLEREFLHDALNEWLDKGNKTGYFYVGNLLQLTRDMGNDI